jgi:regulatory protein
MEGDQKFKKKYTPQQAKLKMESYCAYQERSHFEVKEKLYSYGLYSTDVNEILSHLISNNFLNETRFAEAYVSGKFKIKGWGRNKIKQGLKLKRVSDANIKIGMKQLDADDYFTMLKKIAVKKNKLEKEKNKLKRKYKLISFLAGKGYESDLIGEALKEVLGND